MIGNKIANKIKEFLRNSQQNNSETVINEHDSKIPKEKYVSAEERRNYWLTEIRIGYVIIVMHIYLRVEL